MNADGSRVRRLTRGKASERDPAWSPDGEQIAFTRQGRNNVAEIWVMNADGSGATRLTNDRGYDVQPSWSQTARESRSPAREAVGRTSTS